MPNQETGEFPKLPFCKGTYSLDISNSQSQHFQLQIINNIQKKGKVWLGGFLFHRTATSFRNFINFSLNYYLFGNSLVSSSAMIMNDKC